MAEQKLTPLLEQYFGIKKDFADALLLFQVGDFFELFFDDAKIASQALSITLTKRGKCKGEDIPICGVPVSSVSYHLAKLVKQGYKVALCEQTSKPIPGEIVDREVTRILTPGTLTDDTMLDKNKSSFLCAFWPFGETWSLFFVELLESRIFATTFSKDHFKKLESELVRFFPDEIILPNNANVKQFKQFLAKNGFFTNLALGLGEDDNFSIFGNKALSEYFESWPNKNIFQKLLSSSTTELGLGLLASYLYKYHRNFLPQVEQVEFYNPEDFLVLDFATLKNLEIFRNSFDGQQNGSLVSIVDRCQTGMGSRALRQALAFPLQNLDVIKHRQNFIGILKSSYIKLTQFQKLLCELYDIARIAGRLALDKASFNDLLQLRDSLLHVEKVKALLEEISFKTNDSFVQFLSKELPNLTGLLQFLQSSLADSASGFKILPNFDLKLDNTRMLVKNGAEEIMLFEQHEQARTKIANLKVRYNDILGYYFEINTNQLSLLPNNYVFLQSLAGRNRYTSDDLKILANKIMNAESELSSIEEEVFLRVIACTKQELSHIRKLAFLIGQIDMLWSLSSVAYDYNFNKPEFVEDQLDCLEIIGGRHPVVEAVNNFNFTPNDTLFDVKKRCQILTGPNMGGKSTYLRQIAQIALLAHVGSFVPAQSCRLSRLDRIFTRIGSGDHLSGGKSTFWVEMEEVAQICNQATLRSLVILDEVGRGTSTYDGMALAKAILEYMHNVVGAKVLFATHYHELTDLAKSNSGIINLCVDCKETNGELVFLHKVIPGVAKASFGIAVAKMAGLPEQVIIQAKTFLEELSLSSNIQLAGAVRYKKEEKTIDEQTFQRMLKLEKLATTIKEVDLDEVSFKQAHQLLNDLKEKIL